MSILSRETFQPGATITTNWGGTYTEGTVEVTIRNETRRLPAKLWSDGEMVAHGMVGRYHTGAKAWPACVRQATDGTERARFGRDDSHPKFRKENNIWFA